jgi:hypothetical protein
VPSPSELEADEATVSPKAEDRGPEGVQSGEASTALNGEAGPVPEPERREASVSEG